MQTESRDLKGASADKKSQVECQGIYESYMNMWWGRHHLEDKKRRNLSKMKDYLGLTLE